MLFKLVVCCLVGGSAYAFMTHRLGALKSSRLSMEMQHGGLKIDMTGKKVFIGGVADSTGYGWAIAKACAEAGAEIILGTWPPVLPMFQMGIDRGQFEADSVLSDGSKMKVAKVSGARYFPNCSCKLSMTIAFCMQVYPLDATFDTKESVPETVSTSKRYRAFSGYSIQEVVDKVKADFGTIDYVVHSLANGPEVTKPLLDTSREGYLAASSASAYSLVSMVSRFGPIMNPGNAASAMFGSSYPVTDVS
jgi:enoyl-[acyl-carrier protein] reductase I